jgi:ethanolamine ammonia-lyase large subunit
LIYWVILWEAKRHAFATKYPEVVNKLIIADIGPKFYPQHHQTILAGLNAVNFAEKPSRSDVETILEDT